MTYPQVPPAGPPDSFQWAPSGPPPKRSGRMWVIVGAIVAVVVLVAGGVLAWRAFGGGDDRGPGGVEPIRAMDMSTCKVLWEIPFESGSSLVQVGTGLVHKVSQELRGLAAAA